MNTIKQPSTLLCRHRVYSRKSPPGCLPYEHLTEMLNHLQSITVHEGEQNPQTINQLPLLHSINWSNFHRLQNSEGGHTSMYRTDILQQNLLRSPSSDQKLWGAEGLTVVGVPGSSMNCSSNRLHRNLSTNNRSKRKAEQSNRSEARRTKPYLSSLFLSNEDGKR